MSPKSNSVIKKIRVVFAQTFIDPSENIRLPGAQKQSTIMPIAVGLFAAVGGFIYGYDTGIINSILEMEYVIRHFASNGTSFTAKETSIMVAILSLGTLCGALCAPLLSDTVGRRYAIIISTFVIFMVGNICQIASDGIALFCIGRFITGLSIGIISAVVPLYQAEASPKYLRGAIISTYQWAITWGLLVSSAISQGTHSIDSSISYRLPVGLQFLWSLILGFSMILLPDTPRFYVRKDDLNAAAKSLSRLRKLPVDDPGLIEELVEIKASHDYELSFGTSTLLDCFRSDEGRPRQLKRMLTGISIHAIQQCTGINFIFYYGTNFFSRTGVSRSYLISFVTYAVNVLFTIPGIMLVETIGRRKILIFGGSIMTLSNFIIAIVGVTTNSVIANKVMIAFVCLFIASFAASWGPVAWVVVGEIYSLGVRGKAVAITAATNWLVNFVFAYITPYLFDTGNHTAALGTKIFFIWGGLNFVGVVFVYLLVYETKGLSLEQINELYRSCSTAKSSANYLSPLNIANLNNNITNYNNISNNSNNDISDNNNSDNDNGDDDNNNYNNNNDNNSDKNNYDNNSNNKKVKVNEHHNSKDNNSNSINNTNTNSRQNFNSENEQINEAHEKKSFQNESSYSESCHPDFFQHKSQQLSASSDVSYPTDNSKEIDVYELQNQRGIETPNYKQDQIQSEEIKNDVEHDYSKFDLGYTVDLGYGLGLRGGNEGPPSLFTNSSDEEDDHESNNHIYRNSMSLNEYVSSLSSASDQPPLSDSVQTHTLVPGDSALSTANPRDNNIGSSMLDQDIIPDNQSVGSSSTDNSLFE
ncbi:hypothetical protein WICMUC_005800 [Wickerhamomyces mucosus]|uniref:Major facilitator superfamily (MFS) profile domain-containing protein n=1 Tax=Wickerhamomyces mucosus TaxID=1378264 RepID=A0A9P8T3V9_9ASCO|nr:hypothetical protein WICMUC_005800 [Wickerhamomyces mucosus]